MDDPTAMTADELALEIELALALDGGSDDIRVRAWRLDQFLESGFGLVDSSMLAASSVDIGKARRLIAQGCAPSLASRILV